jgi:DNA repair exonuclease SbcCD ATPase subunit
VISQLQESFETHSKTSKRLNKVTDRTVSTFEAVIERIERIEAPSDLLSTRLQPAIDEIERAARSVRERQEGDAERLGAVERLVNQSVRAAEGLDKRLLGLGRHLDELDGLAERVAKLRGALDGAMAPFADVLSAHQKAIETLRSTADARAKDAGEAFQRIMEDQAKAMSDFTSRLEAARSAVLMPLSEITEERARDLARFSDVFAASLRSIEQHNLSLEAELTKSREATIKVQSQLSEAAELIVKELGVDARANGGELPAKSLGRT